MQKIICLLLAISLLLPTTLAIGAAESSAIPEFLFERINGAIPLQGLYDALYGHLYGEKPSLSWQEVLQENLEIWFGSNYDLVFLPHGFMQNWFENPLYDTKRETDWIKTPILSDALVFVVSEENPITNLTMEQVKAIYAGDITNWQQVGGDDCDITAYQSTEASNSHRILQDILMQDEPLAPAPYTILTTGYHTWESALPYQNTPDAIGYSMYSLLNNAAAGSHMRLLTIDGVQPTIKTIASGEYPLRSHFYAVYKAEMEDSAQRKAIESLVAFIISPEGQRVAQEAGYIPLQMPNEAVSMDEKRAPVVQSRGTGGTALRTSETLLHPDLFSETAMSIACDAIAFPDMPKAQQAFLDWHTECNEQSCEILISRNGNILTLFANLYSQNKTQYLCIDLKKGDKMSLSDVFFDDFDYLSYINEQIAFHASDTLTLWEYFDYREGRLQELIQKKPFYGYTDDFDQFTLFDGHVTLSVPSQDAYFADLVRGYDHVEIMIPLLPENSPFGKRHIKASRLYEKTENMEFERVSLDDVLGDPVLSSHLETLQNDMNAMQDEVSSHVDALVLAARSIGGASIEECLPIRVVTYFMELERGLLVRTQDAYSMNMFATIQPENRFVTDARLYSFATGLPVSLDPLFAQLQDLPGILYYAEGNSVYPFELIQGMEALLSEPLPSYVPQAPVSVDGAWYDFVEHEDSAEREQVLVLRIVDASGKTIRMIVPMAEIEKRDLSLFEACLP